MGPLHQLGVRIPLNGPRTVYRRVVHDRRTSMSTTPDTHLRLRVRCIFYGRAKKHLDAVLCPAEATIHTTACHVKTVVSWRLRRRSQWHLSCFPASECDHTAISWVYHPLACHNHHAHIDSAPLFVSNTSLRRMDPANRTRSEVGIVRSHFLAMRDRCEGSQDVTDGHMARLGIEQKPGPVRRSTTQTDTARHEGTAVCIR
ncbi:hypothetical protein C8Q80DRAFT_344477 [Daedaleopsis nitida]|nr:hypothetical protein C8Q80DRAFT_344477 [Daedaleopsis nitida]